jgi:hypothetical protein
MKAAGHDTIGGVESLFDAIAMMDIDVDVKYSLMISQEFEDAQYDV